MKIDLNKKNLDFEPSPCFLCRCPESRLLTDLSGIRQLVSALRRGTAASVWHSRPDVQTV